MLALQCMLVFITALVISVVLVPVVIKISAYYKLYDNPDAGATEARRIHVNPTPRLGGIAIFLAYIISVIIWIREINILAIILPSCLMFVIGIIDDLKPVPAIIKLVIQIVSAFLVIHFNNLQIDYLTISHNVILNIPYVLGIFLAIFIVVGAVNAINMIDGLDGLSSGIILIAMLLLSYLNFLNTQNIYIFMVYTLPICGAIIGFLKYNTHPANVFMGDGGSNWLGFLLGVQVLLTLKGYAIENNNNILVLQKSVNLVNNVNLLSVLLCLAIPIFDTANVMIARISKGINPMKPDKRHFHHSLLRMGFTHAQAVIFVYFAALVIGTIALLPNMFPSLLLWWTPYLALVLAAVIMPLFLHFDAINIKKYQQKNIILIQFGPKLKMVIHYWEILNRYALYFIFMVTPFLVGFISKEIGYIALVMSVLVFFSLFVKLKNDSFFLSAFLSIASVVLLLANNANQIFIEISGVKYSLQLAYNFIFIWLAISTTCFSLFTFKRKYLIFSPTDFLLLIVPLLFLLFPKEYQEQYKLSIVSLRSLVVFFTIRSMISFNGPVLAKMRLVIFASLCVVVMISLFKLRLVY